MRSPSALFAALLLAPLAAAPLAAQATNVADVGLTMQGSTTLSPLSGQACGAFTCAPFAQSPSPSAVLARSFTVIVYGAPSSLWLLALGNQTATSPCLPIAGIDNALILGLPATLVAVGTTSASSVSTSACRQGAGRFALTIPSTVAVGTRFRLQALTFSATTGGPAFTIAIDARV